MTVTVPVDIRRNLPFILLLAHPECVCELGFVIFFYRPLNSEDSIQKCFKERRALKVSSFTNAKLCPEWYYKLFIPTDTLDEVKMNTACAEESFQFHRVFSFFCRICY